MEKIRVGVIGVGHLGQHHARVFAENPRCELVGVADTNEAAASKMARNWRTQCFFDHKYLLNSVDAVSIAVPTSAHYPVARDFLEAGVHVLVEKPITNNVDEARALIDLAKAKGRVLQVGHIERFNAAIRALRDILTLPRFVECHRLGPFDPRVKDVGVVLDLMIHDLDILLNIVNSPVVDIEAVGIPVLTDNEDIANVRLKFANGCIANLTSSRITPTKKRKIRIFQDDAYIAIDYDRQSLEIYRRIELPSDPKAHATAEIVRKRRRLKREDKLELELDHFLDCCTNGNAPLSNAEDATRALETAVIITERIREATRKLKSSNGSG